MEDHAEYQESSHIGSSNIYLRSDNILTMDPRSPLGAEKDDDDEQSESHVSFPPQRNNFEAAQANSSLSPALSSILTRFGIQQNQNTTYPSTTIMPWAWNALVQASKQNFTASQQTHYEQQQQQGHPIRTTTTVFTQPIGTAMPSPFNCNLSQLSSPRANGQPNTRTWTSLPAQHPQQLQPQPSSQYPQSQQQMKQNQIQILQNLNELSQLFQSRNSDLSQLLQQNRKQPARTSSTSPNSAIAVLPSPNAPAPSEANLFQFSANLIASIQNPNHLLFQQLPAMLETMGFAAISGEPHQEQPRMDADAKSAAADTENIETTSIESDANWGSSPHDRIPKNCRDSGNQRKQHSSPLESNRKQAMKIQKRISQKDYYKDPAANEHGRVLKRRKNENHETIITSQQASNRRIGLTTQYQEKSVESRSEDVGNAAAVATEAHPETQRHPRNNDHDTSAWHTKNVGNYLDPHAKEFLSLSPTTSVSSINEAIFQSNYCPTTNRKINPTIEVVSYFVSQNMNRRKKRKPFKNVNRIPLASRPWHDAQNHKMVRRSMVAIIERRIRQLMKNEKSSGTYSVECSISSDSESYIKNPRSEESRDASGKTIIEHSLETKSNLQSNQSNFSPQSKDRRSPILLQRPAWLAQAIENRLYSAAQSFAEYEDKETLEERVRIAALVSRWRLGRVMKSVSDCPASQSSR